MGFPSWRELTMPPFTADARTILTQYDSLRYALPRVLVAHAHLQNCRRTSHAIWFWHKAAGGGKVVAYRERSRRFDSFCQFKPEILVNPSRHLS
jgi:hypothetical protein